MTDHQCPTCGERAHQNAEHEWVHADSRRGCSIDSIVQQRNQAVRALARLVLTLADTGGYPGARAEGEALLDEDWVRAVLDE